MTAITRELSSHPTPIARTRERDPDRPPWAGLAMVLIGLFMLSLDVAIVNVAAPVMQRNLHLSDAGLVLAVSGYTLSYAVLLVTGARLGNDIGHRGVFRVGLGGFIVASLACGLAPTAGVLIAARVVQGGCGALMAPQVLSIIQTQFAPQHQARAVPLYATVLAAGAAVGQLAGGVLVDGNLFGLTWRPVFLVNVPIGVAVLAATLRLLPPSRGTRPRRPDPVGVVIVAATVLLVMLPLVFGPRQHWPAWTVASFLAALLALASTVLYLWRRGQAGRDPVIDLAFFADGQIRSWLAALLAMQVAYGGFLLAFTVHLQGALGRTPLQSGLTFVPFAVAFAVASLGHRHLPETIQRWAPAAGLVVLAVAYALLGTVNRDGSWHPVSAGLLAAAGASFGLGFSPTVTRTVARTSRALAGEASALVSTTVQLGFTIGVASLGTLYLNAAHGRLASAVAFDHVTLAAAALAGVAALLATSRRGAAGPSEPSTDVRRSDDLPPVRH